MGYSYKTATFHIGCLCFLLLSSCCTFLAKGENVDHGKLWHYDMPTQFALPTYIGAPTIDIRMNTYRWLQWGKQELIVITLLFAKGRYIVLPLNCSSSVPHAITSSHQTPDSSHMNFLIAYNVLALSLVFANSTCHPLSPINADVLVETTICTGGTAWQCSCYPNTLPKPCRCIWRRWTWYSRPCVQTQ